jgi:hypothetical protein
LPATTPQAITGGADGNNVPTAWDEVQNYLDGWYVSASKACHRLFAFDLHGMHPNVYRLVVHLPNEQTTYFPEGTTVGEAMMRNNSTTLIGWCDFNQKAKSEYATATTLVRNNNNPAPSLPVALTSELPIGPTRPPQLCTPLLKLPASPVACYKMMLNGSSAFLNLLACNSPEACDSFLPAC